MKRLEYRLTVQSDEAINAVFVNGDKTIRDSQGRLNLSSLEVITKDYLPFIEMKRMSARDKFERLGALLYKMFFPYPTRGHFEELAWRLVEDHPDRYFLSISIGLQEGLRPDVASLPLEFMYCPRGRTFLATDPRCALSRKPTSRASQPPFSCLEKEESLRIMLVHLQSDDLTTVALPRIKNIICELADGNPRLLRPLVLKNPTPAELEKEMDDYRPHIFQLLAHGRFEDRGTCFALVNASQKDARWFRDRSLADVFQKHRPCLLLLHACEGGKLSDINPVEQGAVRLVQGHIPAVVAMLYPIANEVGWTFSETFYDSLIKKMDLDDAVQRARRALARLDDSAADDHAGRDFGAPVLWMEPDAHQMFKSEDKRMNPPETLTVRITAPDGKPFETNVPPEISGEDMLEAFLDYWRPPTSHKKSVRYALKTDIAGSPVFKVKDGLKGVTPDRTVDFKIVPEPLESDAAVALYVENEQGQRFKAAVSLNTRVGRLADEFMRNDPWPGPIIVEMMGGGEGQQMFRRLSPKATLYDEGVYENAVLKIYRDRKADSTGGGDDE